MAKKILFIISILILGGVIVSSFIFLDNKPPEIKISSSPEFNCDCELNNILDYASATDNKKVKSFFIKEEKIEDVINNKFITYVAIDDSNNVTQLQVPIKFSSEYLTYHIETKKDLILQLGDKLNLNDYFILKNECGTEVYEKFKTSEFDETKAGVYELKIETTIHQTDPIEAVLEVVDARSPKINLTTDALSNYVNRYWSTDYFKEFIESIVDDEDDEDYLLDKVNINWIDVMKPDETGLVANPGDYEITYSVTDSDDNISTKKLSVHLENEQQVIPIQQEGGETYE